MSRVVLSAPTTFVEGDILTLDPGESHHVARVLRRKTGDRIKVLDGRGNVGLAELKTCDSRASEISLLRVHHHPRTLPQLMIGQAVPKGKSMETILKMVTELGASQIRPISTVNGDIPQSTFGSGKKLDKWRAISQEACKQCENPWYPTLEVGSKLSDWVEALPTNTLLIYGSLEDEAYSLVDTASRLRAHQSQGGAFALTIGPEGDFSAEEYALLRENSGIPIRLGTNILRTETATPALLSALISHLDSGGSPS